MNENEIEDNFYMILPSDSNLDINPENSSKSFTVQLEKTLILKDQYVCSLVDFILPESKIYFRDFKFYLVCAPLYFEEETEIWDFNNKILRTYEVICEEIDDVKTLAEEVEVVFKNSDFWENWEELTYIIQDDMRISGLSEAEEFCAININYDKEYNIFSIQNGYNYSKNDNLLKNGVMFLLKFDDDLYDLLGFEYKDRLNRAEFFTDDKNIKRLSGSEFHKFNEVNIKKCNSNSPNELHTSPKMNKFKRKYFRSLRNDFAILCDIVFESFLNEMKMNLLRVCHSDNFGNSVNILKPKIFIPIDLNEINRIKIDLLNIDKNKSLELKNGNTILTLQFKRINQLYLNNLLINENYTQIIILDNQIINSYKGDFEIKFLKNLNFKQNTTCALIEIGIPNDSSTTRFNSDKFVDIIFHFYNFYKFQNSKVEDENENFREEKIYRKSYRIKSGNYDLDKLLNVLSEIESEANKFIISTLKLKFPLFKEDEMAEDYLIYPKTEFKNGFFFNKTGHIYQNAKNSRGDEEKVETAISFYNYDQDLHEILGYDSYNFPCQYLSK